MSGDATPVLTSDSAPGQPPVGSAPGEFYKTGGTMEQNAASYVPRKADHELYEAVTRAEFCYMLTSRQMGKSSMMVRTAVRLRAEKQHVALLDLTAFGQNLTPEQWYDGMASRLGRQVGLEDEVADHWERTDGSGPLRRCIQAITDVVLPRLQGTLVIFLDEIDFTRSLPFSTDEFFSAIRECYNRRTEDPLMRRLTFCVLGVATPADLIRDTRTTPFNIGRRIELNDFTHAEAMPLATGLREDPALAGKLLNRILHWTGGHPYLTQRFCKAVSDRRDIHDAGGVDRLCEEMFLARRAHASDDNLLFVRERILRADVDLVGLLEIYRKVLAHEKVPDAENNPLTGTLRLAGITRTVDGFLQVRNRIYERVFDKKWIESNLLDQERRRQRLAYLRGLIRAGGIAAVVLAAVTTLALIAGAQSRYARREANIAKEQEQIATAAQLKAEEERGNALRASQAAELQRTDAIAARTRANLRLAEARVAQGDALVLNGRWEEARRAYEEAAAGLKLENESTLTADLGLLGVDAHSPPPLLVLREGKPASTPGDPWLGYGISLAANGRTILYGDRNAITRIHLPDGSSEQLKLPIPYASFISFSDDGKQAVLVAKPEVLVLDIASDKVVARWPLPDGGTDLDCYEVVCQPSGETVLLNRLPGKDGFLCDARSGRVKETFTSQTFGANAGGLEKAALISKKIKSFRFGHAVDGLAAVSGDGQTAAIGWRPLELLSMSSGARLVTLQGHNAGVETGLFSIDGQMIVTASQDRTIRLWETVSGGELSCLSPDSHVEVLSATLDLRLVCSGERNGSIKLWASKGAADLLALNVSGVRHMTFAADGLTLLTEDADVLKVWDVATGELAQTLHRPLPAASAPSTQGAASRPAGISQAPFAARTEGIAISPDAAYALSTRSDGSVYVWDVASGKVIYNKASTPAEHPFADFLPNGNKLLVTSYRPYTRDETAQCSIIDLANPTSASGFSTMPSMGRPCLTPDRKTLCIFRFDQLILYDIASGNKVAAAAIQLPESISPDNRIAVNGIGKTAMIVQDESMSLYDLQTGQAFVTDPSHESAIASGALSADGSLIARGAYDGAVTIWDGRQRPLKAIKEYPPSDYQSAVALSPDGGLIATTTDRGAVVIRDLSRPARYRSSQADAVAAIHGSDGAPADAAALAKLGRWYAFRGMDSWAAELFQRARSSGAAVESLAVARCYWRMHQFADARREFQQAIMQNEAPKAYLQLCLAAVTRGLENNTAATQPSAPVK